ncbi:thiamine ABC transporter substrate-binding protein [Proteus mirabilis]|uniref:Thiamine ABC transporter substrate-binding protein n=1 Tax=Proteus mirabilis TaxID=584 RepID=A0A2X2BXD4_PROMI|nr:thiamine ABC transporter substrate-binding protein [Proteus mirabilis]
MRQNRPDFLHQAILIHQNWHYLKKWTDDTFVPYDYGYFAFIYDKNRITHPPKSMDELLNSQQPWKILYQDPRTSTPGLGLMLWMQSLYPNNTAEQWQKLANKTLTVTKGWSESYGLFLKGEGDFVLSYTSSPGYHILADKKDNYAAAIFDEGHYLQVEVAAKLKSSKTARISSAIYAIYANPRFPRNHPNH